MKQKRQIFFGPFRLDTVNQQLFSGDREIDLRAKSFAVLQYLVERPRQTVSKQELLDAIWPDVYVSDTVLKVCIAEIREALGDDHAKPRFIQTRHRRGYCVVTETFNTLAPRPPSLIGRKRETEAVPPASTEAKELRDGEQAVDLDSPSIQMPKYFRDDMAFVRFQKALFSEAACGLRKTNIFDRESYQTYIGTILNNRIIRRTIGSNTGIVHEIDKSLTLSQRLGITRDVNVQIREKLSKVGPLICLVPATLPGAISVFQYLCRLTGGLIDIDYNFCLGSDIIAHIDACQKEMPGICILPIGSVSVFLKRGRKSHYRPFMLMPMGSQHVMAPGVNKGKTIRRCLLLKTRPSSSLVYYDELKSSGLLGSKIESENIEPEDSVRCLGSLEKDACVIQWFPIYHFSEALYQGACLIRDDQGSASTATLLFVHESLESDPLFLRSLNILIRDAWLTLKEDRDLLESVIRGTMLNSNYLKILMRSAGLHEYYRGAS
jgi:DNA-binding winged helix-turn-helix (wHTH) protein